MNSAQDTLPHNSNLVRWQRPVKLSCPLCGGLQSLRHVLNGCERALQERRYNPRHDKVLKVILWYIRKHLCAPGFHISGDLSSKVYDFPMHFCPTTEISDIVLWKEQTKQIFFIELMYVCVQDNFADASLRKRTGAMTSQHN